MKKINILILTLVSIFLLTACGESYESIYNDYSSKLQKEYENAQKELDDDVAANMNINDLANSCTEKVNKLAEISTEGTEKMAALLQKRPTTASDYMKWGQKLYADYMSYGTKLEGTYMKGATNSISDIIGKFSSAFGN